MKEGAELETFGDVDLSILNCVEKAQCEGKPDLIVELIGLNLADVPLQLSAIKDFILKADEVYLKRLPIIKGSSANLGVISIARLCGELQQIDFIQSLQKTSAYVNHLEQAFARVRRFFSRTAKSSLCCKLTKLLSALSFIHPIIL